MKKTSIKIPTDINGLEVSVSDDGVWVRFQGYEEMKLSIDWLGRVTAEFPK
jgi:hypothetical protein